jgi:hypothetical protein
LSSKKVRKIKRKYHHGKIYSNHYAFAALKADGSITVWGSSEYGGTTDFGIWSRIQFIHSYFNLIAGNIYQRHHLWEVLP